MSESTEEPIKDDNGCKGRRWLLFFAFTSTFLYSGASYGWGPMQLVLEQNGIFHDKCGDVPTEEVCDAQTSALLNVRLVSQLTIVASPLLGELSDRKGSRYLAYFMTAMVFAGLFLIIVADQAGADWLMYVAFMCIALAGWSGGLLTVATGLVFQGKRRSRVISGLNACYDAGAITYLGLWGVSEISDATLTDLIALYLGLAVLCLGGLAVSWAKVLPENQEIQKEAAEGAAGIEAGDSNEITDLEVAERLTHKQRIFEREKKPFTEQDSTAQSFRDIETEADHTCRAKESDLPDVSNGDKGDHPIKDVCDDEPHTEGFDSSTTATSQEYVIIANRSVKGQLLSEPVVMLCAFFAFHLASNVWTLVTARDFLKHLGDDQYNNRYLTIFTLITPVSLLALPFEDVAIHKFGFPAALQTVNVLAVAHGTIKVVTTSLNVQVLGFVIFSFFRCFLFAVTFSCLPNIVSLNVTGRAVGIFYLTGGVASFINIPLSNLAVNQLDSNFFVPNLVYLILTLPCFYAVWRVGKGLERDDEARSAKSRGNAIISRRVSSIY